MLDLIDEQLGRLLFVAALGFSVAVAVVGGSTEARFPDEETVKDHAAVQVPLAAEQLLPAETYFPEQDAAYYRGSDTFVFVKPKEVKQYEAIDLDVPPAAVMRPPGVLPSPGPSLEGTEGLPRWGEELPAPLPSGEAPKTGSK
ncbi:MAG: hypothetical protein KIS92_11405 [Planctomycetota bacterium]|nr:hypothetical protein [Planctomycetota bacterium]